VIVTASGRTGLQALDGMTGKEAFAELCVAFRVARARYTTLWVYHLGGKNFREKYDAPNGWGSTEGAILFLGLLMAACASSPKKRLAVSC
jgi:hypothetical protein